MSDERLSRRSAGGAQTEGAKAGLDRVIDQVAREMTEGALPGDFRARVVAQIATNHERRARWLWIFAPVTAAAAIVVAIVLARGSHEPALVVARPQPAAVAQAQTPKVPAAIEPRQTLQRGVSETAKRQPQHAVAQRAIESSDVDALAPPPIVAPSIAIRTLTTDSLALEALEAPARIAIAPLATPEGEHP